MARQSLKITLMFGDVKQTLKLSAVIVIVVMSCITDQKL